MTRLARPLAVLGAVVIASGLALVPAPTVGAAALLPHATGFGSDWPVYHHDALGSGVDGAGTSLSPATAAWTSTALDGQLYGEPLVEAGRVIAATENNTVYALAANTGAVLWSTHIAAPVPSGNLPCGNISPTVGITSTPVIDASLGEVFVVADESTAGNGAAHHLVGLDLYTGVVKLDTAADPTGSHPLYQLQRAALALDAGKVLVGFGGNAGDCETSSNPYHGWLVGIPELGGTMQTFEVASNLNDSQGAIWMGGGSPIVDGSSNIWVATGNSAFSSSSDLYDLSDGVVELNSSLVPQHSFAPATWYSDNGADADLGSSSPALLGSGGLLFQAGKSQTAYVMSQTALGGVGGQLASAGSYCGNDVDGGSAVSGNVVYTPCLNGVVKTQVVNGNPPTITSVWQTSTGSGGPPIVAGGLVWTIDPGNGHLYGLDPNTGNASQNFALGSVANHFPTPAVADGLLLAASTNQVHAFDGPGGLPPAPPPPPLTSNLLHVAGGVTGGALTDFVPDHAGGRVWNTYNLSAAAGGPGTAGAPSEVVAGGLLHLFIRASTGHLVEYVDDAAGGRPWNAYDHTLDAGGGALVLGDPTAVLDGTGTIHVYVQGPNNHLVEYLPDHVGGHVWNVYDHTLDAGGGSQVNGEPTAVLDNGGTVHVYVEGPGGHLVEYLPDHVGGHVWNVYDHTLDAGGGSQVNGRAGAVLDGTGTIHVYVQGPNNHLLEYLPDHVGGHVWNVYDHTLDAGGGVPVVANPSAVLDSGGTVHVYVQGPGGHLLEYLPDHVGGHVWNVYDHTLDAGGTTLFTDPGAAFVP